MEANPSASAKKSEKAVVEPNVKDEKDVVGNIKDKSPVELREMMVGSKETLHQGSDVSIPKSLNEDEKPETQGKSPEKPADKSPEKPAEKSPEKPPEKSPEKPPERSPDKSPVKSPQRRPTIEKMQKNQRSPPLEKQKTKSGVVVDQSKSKVDTQKKSPPKPDASKIEISSKKSGSINEQMVAPNADGNQDGVWCGSTETMAPMRMSNASGQVLSQDMKYFTPGPRSAYLQVATPSNMATSSQGPVDFNQAIVDQQRTSEQYRPMQQQTGFQYPSNLQGPSGYVTNMQQPGFQNNVQQPYPNAQVGYPQGPANIQPGGYPPIQQQQYPPIQQQQGYQPNVQQGYQSNIQLPSGYPSNIQQPSAYPTNVQAGFPSNIQPPAFPTNVKQPSGYVAQQPLMAPLWQEAPQEMNPNHQFSFSNDAGARPDDAGCSSSRQPEGIQVVQYLPRFQASQKSQSFLHDIPNNAVLLVPVEEYRNWNQTAPVKHAREKSAQYQYPVDQQVKPFMLDASTQPSKAYDTVPLESELLRKDNRPIGAFAVKERSRENLAPCRGPTTAQYGRGVISNVAPGYRNFNQGNYKFANFNERNNLRGEPSRIQRPEKKDDFLDKYREDNEKYSKDKDAPLAKAASSKPAWKPGPYNKSQGCGGGYSGGYSGANMPVKNATGNPLSTMRSPFIPYPRQDFQGPCYDPVSQRVILNKPQTANRGIENAPNRDCPEVTLTCSEVEIALRTRSTRNHHENEKYVNSPTYQNSKPPSAPAQSIYNLDQRKYYGLYEDDSDTQRDIKARKCSDSKRNQPRSPRGRRSKS